MKEIKFETDIGSFNTGMIFKSFSEYYFVYV